MFDILHYTTILFFKCFHKRLHDGGCLCRSKSADSSTDGKRGCGRQGDMGHLRRIIFVGMVPVPPFGITSRQNMQSLWLVAQRGADSKCPRQKLFHIPQQEGLQPSSKKMDLLPPSTSQKRFVPMAAKLIAYGVSYTKAI